MKFQKISWAKDKKRFEKMFFEYYEPLCQKVYKIVKDQEATKDIVQDTFIKFWKKQNQIQIKDSTWAYLYKSCLNEALNYLKQNDRRTRREESYYVDHQSRRTDLVDSELKIYEQETGRRIQETLSQLPSACKEAFMLSRFEEMSYKEIATHLNITVNTVEKHIGKALRILRERLK